MGKSVVASAHPLNIDSEDWLGRFERILYVKGYMLHHTSFDGASYLAQVYVM
jgi:hypothetical protein